MPFNQKPQTVSIHSVEPASQPSPILKRALLPGTTLKTSNRSHHVVFSDPVSRVKTLASIDASVQANKQSAIINETPIRPRTAPHLHVPHRFPFPQIAKPHMSRTTSPSKSIPVHDMPTRGDDARAHRGIKAPATSSRLDQYNLASVVKVQSVVRRWLCMKQIKTLKRRTQAVLILQSAWYK